MKQEFERTKKERKCPEAQRDVQRPQSSESVPLSLALHPAQRVDDARLRRGEPRIELGTRPLLRLGDQQRDAPLHVEGGAPPLLATVLVSAKLLDDECYNNHYWASVGGVTLQHLNQLELEVMCLLDFEVLVTATMIDAARARLLTTSS